MDKQRHLWKGCSFPKPSFFHIYLQGLLLAWICGWNIKKMMRLVLWVTVEQTNIILNSGEDSSDKKQENLHIFNWVPSIPDLYIVPQFFFGQTKITVRVFGKNHSSGPKNQHLLVVVWSGWWTISSFTWNMVGNHHFYLSTQKTGCLKFQDDLNPCKNPSKHSWKSVRLFFFQVDETDMLPMVKTWLKFLFLTDTWYRTLHCG